MSNKTFSDKHRELFPYLAQGKTTSEIATALGMKPPAVSQRINNMMGIIKCAERADLEQFCREVLEDASSDAS
jgi:DNA-binding CsgD family transcriptional regulator